MDTILLIAYGNAAAGLCFAAAGTISLKNAFDKKTGLDKSKAITGSVFLLTAGIQGVVSYTNFETASLRKETAEIQSTISTLIGTNPPVVTIQRQP